MKSSQLTVFLVALLAIVGCSSPDVDATVDARIATALAGVPTVTPQPTSTPQPPTTPQPTATPQRSPTPQPTTTPQPPATPQPTATPQPPSTPQPTATPQPIPTVSPSTRELYAAVRRSVVRIVAGNQFGSGWAIEDGWVITNAHIVEGFSQVSVRIPTDDEGSYISMFGTVRGIDTTRDLAAVEIAHNMPVLARRVATTNDIGTPLIQVGYSAGSGVFPAIHTGVIANVLRHLGPVIQEADTLPDTGSDSSGVGVVIFDADADPGDSGGPVADLDGIVVAITFGSTVESGGKRVLGQQRGTSVESIDVVWDDLKRGVNTSSQ